MSSNNIRPIVICLCSFENRILVIDWFDKVKREKFYRPPGGGIEFGEFGKDALIREFQEEFHLELVNIKFLFTLENIFVCDGQKGHEIVLVYDAQLRDAAHYGTILSGKEDNGETFQAYWRSLDEIRQDNRPLYPDGLAEKLKNARKRF